MGTLHATIVDAKQICGAYALPLLEASFAVVAPANRATGPGRNRLEFFGKWL
jgi:hypothetical protein